MERFMDWHTVPLKGTLERLPDGSKTIPHFSQKWKEHYTHNKNTTPTAIGGVLTGELSGIVAIDCDNDHSLTIFRALDPTYSFVFVSKGKQGGTFIYAYTPALPDNFIIKNDHIELDFYSNNGFVYLPTAANTSKEPFPDTLPALSPMPPATEALLQTLKAPTPQLAPAQKQNILTAQCLAPLVKQFTNEQKFMPGLFKIITPRDFRTEPQYVQQGFLHPENVPAGRGSEYLSKVSAILGADVSIDHTLYVSALHDINTLFKQPMDAPRIDKTIADPMLHGNASVDGIQLWQYDEDWAAHRMIMHTKRQSSIELGFDDHRAMYYYVDPANEHVKSFARDSEFYSYLQSVVYSLPKKIEVKSAMPIINVQSEPNKPFGFHAGDDPTARSLNTFIRTPELAILDDPAPYAPLYKRPETTLKFLRSLVPEEKMQDYLLSFMKRKLTTFDYSPVVLYFLGVSGSGKDTFVELVEQIMGKVAKPTTKEFLEMFNGWMLDTYFAQLDEYGNQLTTMREKDEALGKLKAYTGKQVIQIRQMRNDGYQHKHNVTFIMTANTNPFGIEDGDRRIALLSTPNVLIQQEWVHDMTAIHDAIMAESVDFCYYLATEVPDLHNSAYQLPPASAGKQELIADSMYAAQRIAFVLKNGMLDYLKNLAKDHNCAIVVTALENKRLTSAALEELYDIMTDYKGNMRALNNSIRTAGIKIKATSSMGDKTYYYDLEWK